MERKQVWKYSVFAIYIVIWLVFRTFPTVTEHIYSKGIYPYIAKVLHFLFGWIPFSMGDILYTLFIIGIFFVVVKHFKKLWQAPLKILDKIFSKIIRIAFAFFFLWGFNYFRVDFWLSQKEIYRIAYNSYPLEKQGVTDFKAMKSVKPSLYSKLLTYMGYSGYLNPFTNEAQVNRKMIGYSVPITVCHEIAHQMGYGAEEEANYLGYLAALKTDNPYFKYSAELFALRYFLNEVAQVAPTEYESLHSQIHKGIFENYKEVRLFWQQYENKAEPVFKASYDAFLKANKQSQGINSYDLVVGLLIPHYVRN